MIVVGAGNMGQAWLRTLAADGRWQIAALVDVSAGALAAAGETHGVPPELRFSSVEEAMHQVIADGMLVASLPESHSEAILLAVRHGLPVFTEKPLTATLAEAVAVLAESRDHNGIVMVGQGRRWCSHIVALREAVASGVIGEPGYITCQFRIPFRFGGWREQMPEVLLEDLAIHHFDTLRFISGRNGERVFAHSFRPAWSWFGGNPCANVDLLLEGGLPVHYFGSWVARGPRSSWDGELTVVGSDGALLLREDETLWLYRGENETPEPFPFQPLEPVGLALGLERFTQAVLGTAPPAPDIEDNMHSLALTSAAVASARSGQPVHVAEHLREAGYSQGS
jgi:predicted dehydrogenase